MAHWLEMEVCQSKWFSRNRHGKGKKEGPAWFSSFIVGNQ